MSYFEEVVELDDNDGDDNGFLEEALELDDDELDVDEDELERLFDFLNAFLSLLFDLQK